jgi:Family of unknown function (DUF6049)
VRHVARSFWTAACLLAASAAIAPLGAATPVSTAQTTRTDILGLISQTAVVEPDDDLTIRLRVTGAPNGATIRVDVHGRMPTRTDFQASMQGRNLRSPVGSPTIVSATPDVSGTVVVSVATRDLQSTTPADPQRPTVRVGEGVFPVTIALLDGRTTIQQLLTYMVRLPVSTEFAPLGVAVVLPLGGKPALQPDGTVALDEATKDAVVSSSSVLSAHKDVPLTIMATPETVDALEPASIDAVKAAVAGRPLALTPYVRLQPSEWITSGLDNELTQQFDRGTQSLSAALTAPASSVFVADDRLTSEAARFLRARGVTSMVVPDDALSGLDVRVFNRTLTQPFVLRDSDGITAVAADAGLAAHLGSTGDPVIDANHLVADLSVLYFDDPPDDRAATFVLPEDRPIDSRFLDALLGGLSPTVNRILRPMTLPGLFGSVPVVSSRGDVDSSRPPLTRSLQPKPSADLSSFGRRLGATNEELSSYRTMVVAPNPLPDDFERRALVAGANGLSDQQRTSYLDGASDAIHGELDKIQAPPRQSINFTARDGVVSLTFRLTTGYPVTVDLFLQGEKLEFPEHEDGHIPLTLTDETTRVPINVRTRASGDSALDVTLQTPDGSLVIDRTRVTVRSTAFSGVGVVLSVGAGTFLALWWGRHIVVARRGRRRPRHIAP